MTDYVTLMEASWPPAERLPLGPFVLRRGAGGGQRVSAASAIGKWNAQDLDRAEAAMRQMGQAPLMMLTPQETTLDQALAGRGYQIKDPVVVYATPAAQLAASGPDHMTTFPHWPPMNIAGTLWADGLVGPERLAIMQRAQGPKTAILGRVQDRAAGVVFAAMANRVAFVHALHVVPALRRQGLARNLMRAAAVWAADQGAQELALAVTEANPAARALYALLGMEVVGQYHYRHLAD